MAAGTDETPTSQVGQDILVCLSATEAFLGGSGNGRADGAGLGIMTRRHSGFRHTIGSMSCSRFSQLTWVGATIVITLVLWQGSAAVAADPVAPSYRLGPEDVLHISVWKDETLTREVVVRPDGFVSFPLVGDILAMGKTVDQFTDDLKDRLSQYIPNPPVSVAVIQVNSFKIYVIGKVNRPGEYLVGHNADVLRALSLAGGLTPYASQSNIKILRRIDDKQVVFPFDYGDVISGENLEQNIILLPRDTVMVP